MKLAENKKRRRVQLGVRLPVDLAETMDKLCESGDITRTDLVVAALRKHLGKPAPAALGRSET